MYFNLCQNNTTRNSVILICYTFQTWQWMGQPGHISLGPPDVHVTGHGPRSSIRSWSRDFGHVTRLPGYVAREMPNSLSFTRLEHGVSWWVGVLSARGARQSARSTVSYVQRPLIGQPQFPAVLRACNVVWPGKLVSCAVINYVVIPQCFKLDIVLEYYGNQMF